MLERSREGRTTQARAFVVLDLSPVPSGSTPAEALRNTLDLAPRPRARSRTSSHVRRDLFVF